MRIAHVITRMIIGGAQENTLHNCQDLVHLHGDEVLLITGPAVGPEGDLLRDRTPVAAADTGPRGRAGRFDLDGLPIQLIDSLRRNIHPVHDWKAARELRRVLHELDPDVVHTHSAKGGLLGRYVGWGLKRRTTGKRPVVVHTVHGAPFHDYQSKSAHDFFVRCERWAAARCHKLISVADAMTDLMVDAGVTHRDKFVTIHSGMNVDPFVHATDHRERIRTQFGLREEHVVVGKVARLFHLKGHADLIAAAKQVADSHPNVRFLLVGDGILREELQQQIATLGLQEHFIFAGLVPPSEVPAMIGAMDVLVHASYREGLARALPQALIAGRPAISYDIDGAREVVIDDETGYLVGAGQIGPLADRIGRLVGDSELRHRMGAEGHRRFTDLFRHQTMTQRIRDLYQELCDQHG
ncbi:glycosyltransferase family 4 protein [Rhodopirellula halodulae]|uniref:glycosyltransferase family 4 protein n=1 Tax=Rhodopirellula halodulae TaxID=2894198 RepID=UPI001E29E9B5|nr:glycosyltransferase family 4 protein [Rhodopirellula sp. JC737]MCC9657212.1 glycosyltransferase family 4 protein [Rhodopirellula sp. JC737]